jgi:hypothetical protein
MGEVSIPAVKTPAGAESVRPKGLTFLVPFLWALVAGCLMFGLELYEGRPGPKTPLAASWPGSKQAVSKSEKPTLVMFCHPQCPCTRASLEQLDKLVSANQGKLNVIFYFVQPAGEPDSWVKTDTWDHARRIPDATAYIDLKGQQVHRFGVATSGETILYSPEGKELFRGGVTPSRGHEGGCKAVDAVADYLAGKEMSLRSAPVFGCPLLSEPVPNQ